MKLSELLTDASKWTQGVQARDASGNSTDPKGESVVSLCLMGAANRATHTSEDFTRLRLRLLRSLPPECGNSITLERRAGANFRGCPETSGGKRSMKLQDLLTDESKWTKRASARSDTNEKVDPHHHSAVKFCLFGAIERVAQEDYARLRSLLSKVRAIVGDIVTMWNDAPQRTFEDVRKLLEENDL